MKKIKIYIETTVVSYFSSRYSQNRILAGRQAATRHFWSGMIGKYDVYISDLVLQEAQKGDIRQAEARLKAIDAFSILKADLMAKKLADILLKEKAVPENSPEDAAHIAIAAVNGIDIIVTWNFSHINNPFTKMMIRQIIENTGLMSPGICSPEELLGDEI